MTHKITENNTVKLVNRWAQFEESHPNGTVEDFCRATLLAQQAKETSEKLFGGKMVPPRQDIALMKLLKRIIWYHSLYTNIAMKGLAIKKIDDFHFLNYIHQMKNPRKTDVIYEHMQELSTGLSILEGLKSVGYIKEEGDDKDKRSKRLKITNEGEKVLRDCYEKFACVSELLIHDMPKEDTQLCTQLLMRVDSKFNSIWKKHRGKTIEEIYLDVLGKAMRPKFRNHK